MLSNGVILRYYPTEVCVLCPVPFLLSVLNGGVNGLSKPHSHNHRSTIRGRGPDEDEAVPFRFLASFSSIFVLSSLDHVVSDNTTIHQSSSAFWSRRVERVYVLFVECGDEAQMSSRGIHHVRLLSR